MKNWKKKFECLLLLVFCFGQIAMAQVERSKKVDRSYSGKNVVSLIQKNGPLNVKTSTDGQVHVHAELVVKAKTEEAVEAVFAQFDVQENDFGDQVEIQTSMGPYSATVNTRTMWVKFGDGPKIKGVQSFKINVVLEIPAGLKALKLENKYDDIYIQDKFSGDLAVEIYSGKLKAKDIAGALDLSMKYSEAHVGNVGDTKLDIYDSNLWLGELAKAEVKSKYSEFEVAGVLGDFEMNTYDDEWEVGDVAGEITLKDKYSEFEFTSCKKFRGEIYDAAIEMETAGEVFIDESKYSEYKFGKIEELKFDHSYDDDVRVKEAAIVSVDHSKYTEYRVSKLSNTFRIGETYDDSVDLDWVSSKFKALYIDGKYTDMDVNIESGAQFEVEVDMKYGSFDYPENNLDVRIWKEKDSIKSIKGFAGGEPATSQSFFTVKGYDNDVDWN